ncbi:unnamed protein product [Rhizoctonia solani]|uniref:Uncharacterized protein n=1 Tax=Rhizoctonia solani TaxID=456999 RepID=A0A8H3HMR7_9AGAM|nr:unnamed protein product [Rhizoctonia solani]
MVSLPIEILRYICELAAERIDAHPHNSQHVGSANIHFMSLLGFSQASRACREVSAPYLFRRLKVITAEQASNIVKSSIAQHARHIHFPATDALTCRRPINSSVLQLVSQATSICISANASSFFYTARTPLSSLLRSAKKLLKLELYCEPIAYRLDTLALIGNNIIPTCPESLRALYITIPGGQPDYTGPDVCCS